MEVIHKIGRRKTAVARVYVSDGKGNITVNKKDINTYFPTATLQYKVNQALVLTDNEKSLELFVKYSFKKVGIKKEWIFSEGKMKDEILFQLIKE